MYLEKVLNLEQLKLGKNQVLVELVRAKQKGSIIVTDSLDSLEPTEIVKEVVITSNFEDIVPGDIVIDARYALGKDGVLKFGERSFVIAFGHDIKLWVKPENYDENLKVEKKKSSILEAAQGLSKEDLRKIQTFQPNKIKI